MNLHRHPPPTDPARVARRMSRRCGPVAAFMVEIAMALAVIGFALVAILGILPMGMDVQKNNRRETVINQDANFLIETIRGGARGVDDLTNYVTSITNYWTIYRANGTRDKALPTPYDDFDGYDYLNSTVPGLRLNYGSNIVGLLSTPKYTTNAGTAKVGAGAYQSNYVIAYVQAISGVALEKFPQRNDVIKGAAFSYRLVSELTPYGVTSNGMFHSAWTNYLDPNVINPGASAAISAGVNRWVAGLNDLSTNANQAVTNFINPSDVKNLGEFISRANRWLVTRNLQPNLYELRLVFRWPLLPGFEAATREPKIGPGRQAYRAMISGALTNDPSGGRLWFMRPQNYVQAQ